MVKCPVEHVKQAGSDVACYPGSINDINRLTTMSIPFDHLPQNYYSDVDRQT